jgi:hypothetical protein
MLGSCLDGQEGRIPRTPSGSSVSRRVRHVLPECSESRKKLQAGVASHIRRDAVAPELGMCFSRRVPLTLQ